MKEFVTEHRPWCAAADNSRVFWDEETDITRCEGCGAITEERDTDVEQQMIPEVDDGHEA